MTSASRKRLPNRRPALTETLEVNSRSFAATIGFDNSGQPREVFLAGAKDGSGLAAILDDASVVISVALQHGISAEALAKSVARLPRTRLEPPYLGQPGERREAQPASVIGAALDLVRGLEG